MVLSLTIQILPLMDEYIKLKLFINGSYFIIIFILVHENSFFPEL